ncbi:hypothetical protein RCC89_12210 [Cytophagaceae bacterium ABcell3]|nr:hypothetical protein RCC89_12210 [Cytophagaceae bacterium ABcell3]
MRAYAPISDYYEFLARMKEEAKREALRNAAKNDQKEHFDFNHKKENKKEAAIIF